MTSQVENVNAKTLRQCREQMALDLDRVKKKVGSIAAIEAGEKYPTFKQLDTLADLYKVPRWVFVADKLPKQYDFARSAPAFRRFADLASDAFADPKVRGLVAQVGRFRELVLELQEDADEPVPPFAPPALSDTKDAERCARETRRWLAVDGNLPFEGWKAHLEQKGIFVFMTSKYKGWSHVDKLQFRGLSMPHATLPIIVINNSDARKAHSFTLLHELGHLLRQEPALDSWHEQDAAVEKWCDQFAGAVLMPAQDFRNAVEKIAGGNPSTLKDVEKLADKFQVSSYACLVRLRTLEVISQRRYAEIDGAREAKYRQVQDALRQAPSGPARERSKEALEQYGRLYAGALFQAYHNDEIGLHRLCKAFDLKRVSQLRELAASI